MSIFVLAELYTGFKGGSKETENKYILERFLSRPTVRTIPATRETAEIFAGVKHGLRKAGTPLPINDVWIAAHAIESGSVLITFDSHFKDISGLRLWDTL
jgi:tRNA(fMet)-specific endonuclease VapC